MAITINGTGSITGLTAGGLPDGSVTAADIETSLDLTGKTVTLPSGTGGKILQVQHSIKNTHQYITNANSSAVDITDMTATITPSSTSSKILVLFNLSVSTTTDYFTLKTYRGSTEIFNGTLNPSYTGNTVGTFGSYTPNQYMAHSVAGAYVDEPASTSALTYKQAIITPYSSGYDVYVNWMGTGADGASYVTQCSSSFVLLEVAG